MARMLFEERIRRAKDDIDDALSALRQPQQAPAGLPASPAPPAGRPPGPPMAPQQGPPRPGFAVNPAGPAVQPKVA